MDLPDFAKESVAQIQILYTFQAHAAKGRRTKQNVGAPGEKPARLQPRSYPRPARNPCARSAWSAMRSDVAGECRSPKVISVSVDLLHKIFIIRKDELVKDLPAT